MGKNNKKRKRANHALFHAVKARMNGEAETTSKEEVKPVEEDTPATPSDAITDKDFTTSHSTLETLVSDRPLFHSKRFKELRRTLHPLVIEQLQSYDKGVDYCHKVTVALQQNNYSDALAALQACEDFQQLPKQGIVQRWVRDCKNAAPGCQFQLYQAILRVSSDGNKHDPAQALADVKARMNSEETTPKEEVKPEEDIPETATPSDIITDKDLTTTLSTLKKLVSDRLLFHSKRFKDLRRTLHPLVIEKLQSYDKGVDYRQKVTLSLQQCHYSDALAALQACQDFQQVPKQGTVQRWVRDCKNAAPGRQFQLYQAILRVSSDGHDGNKHDPAQALADHLAESTQTKEGMTVLPGFKWWENGDEEENESDKTDKEEEEKQDADAKKQAEEENPKATEEDDNKQDESETKLELNSRILYQEEAAKRTPPNHYDLHLHTTDPGSIAWASTPLPTKAHPIPFLPKPARVLSNVLTPHECQRLRTIMTTLGYRPDHPTDLPKPTGIDSCEWMVPQDIADTLTERVRPHLPQTLTLPHGSNRQVQLHSINPRWRGFRYAQECVYRPHLDGSWPQSFVTPEGEYGKQSDVKSYLTFLIYLNDDFQGGETRFYLPHGVARGIVPQTGSVVIFPQGNLASLIHEGSQVLKGVKYVVRTDVLYQPYVEEEEEEGDDGDDEPME